MLQSASTFCRSATGEYTSLSTSALATMKRKKSNAGVVSNLKKMYDDVSGFHPFSWLSSARGVGGVLGGRVGMSGYDSAFGG